MEVLNLIGILRIKDENGEWQEIQAIKGTPGIDGKDGRDGVDYVLTQADKQEIAGMVDLGDVKLDDYATIQYVDEAVANIDIPEVDLSDYPTREEVSGLIPDVDLSDYSTTEQMNEAISRSRYNIGQGLFYNQQNNMIGVGLVNSGRLVINNGMLDINQNNLFTVQNQYVVVNTAIDNIPVVSGINTVTVSPMIVGEELQNWINKMTQSPRNILINMRMGNGVGFGNAVIPNTLLDYTLPNGKTYSFAMDMTNVLGSNIQQATGFTSLYIGFNGDTFDIVFESNGASIPPITMISFAEFTTNPSMAHFWIGNGNQFRRYNNGNMMFLELNDNYINGLIDNRLSSIGVAEAGVY